MNSIKKKILDFQKFIKKKIFKTKNRYPTVAAMLIREDWSNEKQIISTKIAVLKKMNPIKKKMLDFQKYIKKKAFKIENQSHQFAAILIKKDWPNKEQFIFKDTARKKKKC